MTLGIMEVGLGLGDFMFDGNPAPPEKKGTAPNQFFGPCQLWANGCMDQDATLYRGNIGPGDVVLDGVAAPPPLKGGTAPSFRSKSIVTKGLDG